MKTEYDGTLNLSQVAPVTENSNTVLVKLTINSNEDQLKSISFGYSDIARLFVNDEIIYSGQRKFRSRDYRYLGTIGFFDKIYLNLKAGNNEIVFAVTENMGGWGLKAKFIDESY